MVEIGEGNGKKWETDRERRRAKRGGDEDGWGSSGSVSNAVSLHRVILLEMTSGFYRDGIISLSCPVLSCHIVKLLLYCFLTSPPSLSFLLTASYFLFLVSFSFFFFLFSVYLILYLDPIRLSLTGI